MAIAGKPRPSTVSTLRVGSLAVLVAVLGAGAAAAASIPQPADPGALLSGLRPDYRDYILEMRPLAAPTDAPLTLYMALVRPGAVDPASIASAPFAGPGARNDILYDDELIGGPRGAGWALLLLDHEYFHARHLAGMTSLPLPGAVRPDVERHYFEAAAWVLTVAEARAGRYPGLRWGEFHEALERWGDHYEALRRASLRDGPGTWERLSVLLDRPVVMLRTSGSRP